MTQDQARRLILREWPRWAVTKSFDSKPSRADAMPFVDHLQRTRPTVLAFRCPGKSKSQFVIDLLSLAGLLSD